MSRYYKGEPKINYSIKIDGTFLSGTKRDVIKVGNYLEAKDNRIAELEKERSEFIECLELLNNKVIGREYGLDSEEIWEITKKFLNENTEKE